MILGLKNGKVDILKNSLESVDSISLRLIFNDLVLTNNAVVKVFIDKTELKKIDTNLYKFDFSTIRRGENKLKVFVYQGEIVKTYETIMSVKNYISFDSLGHEKFPQMILDINEKIKNLENLYKKIESKIDVI